MKNFCYCVGGTGARVSEAAAHLCAMNLIGEKDITFIIVDKDANCGGTKQARGVIESVAALAQVNSVVGLKRSGILFDNEANQEFCKSNIHVENWDFTEALDEIVSADGTSSLKVALGVTGTSSEITDGYLFDAFYSKDEQDRDTAQGFYGHPSIGALIFKYMIENGKWSNPNVQSADDIAFPVKDYLRQNPGAEAKVFIVGSIFGGTGASIFSNLAAHIRNSIVAKDKNRVYISGALLLPYFTFSTSQGKLVDPTDFYEKSKVAMTQYANDPNLMKKNDASSGTFDTLYVCGQDPLHTTSSVYCHGGTKQNNHFDLVDLVAAKAMTEFFNGDKSAVTGGKIYEYRFNSTQNGVLNCVTMSNTVGLQREMVKMIAFSNFIITRVYGQLKLRGDDPYNNAMVRMLYGKSVCKGLGHKPTTEYNEDIKPAMDNVADLIFGYCKSFVRFAYDIACNGHDWSGNDNNSHDGDYSLFNADYLARLNNICKYFETGNSNDAVNAINIQIKSDNILPNGAAGITPIAIETLLQGEFSQATLEQYDKNGISVNLRMADYIHQAFKHC